MLNAGERNQDIQALVNLNRPATINFARISEVKANAEIEPAKGEAVAHYKKYKHSFDPLTKLNHYDDEKLIRSREAMLLAVNIFNSPTLLFKSEVFSMLTNVAWTYLLHVFYEQKEIDTVDDKGFGLTLATMLDRKDCPLTEVTIANLKAVKEIRNAVEHTFFAKSDQKFLSKFQANCLNYDHAICQLFGDTMSLKKELSFSLQFAQLDMEQIHQLSEYDIPKSIKVLDARLEKEYGEFKDSIEYQFSVNYELVAATKAAANVNFKINSADFSGQPHNVLIKKVVSDENWPHKAGAAAKLISERSGKEFSVTNHTSAWRFFDARPPTKAKQPVNTNKEYCVYHPAHKDYTYSNKWIDMVSEYILDEDKFGKLKKK